MNRRSQKALYERAAGLGRGLKYRYESVAAYPCLQGNNNQWVLIHNYDATSYKTLKDVDAELTRLESGGT